MCLAGKRVGRGETTDVHGLAVGQFTTDCQGYRLHRSGALLVKTRRDLDIIGIKTYFVNAVFTGKGIPRSRKDGSVLNWEMWEIV